MVELETKVKGRFAKISQSRRRPLLLSYIRPSFMTLVVIVIVKLRVILGNLRFKLYCVALPITCLDDRDDLVGLFLYRL